MQSALTSHTVSASRQAPKKALLILRKYFSPLSKARFLLTQALALVKPDSDPKMNAFSCQHQPQPHASSTICFSWTATIETSCCLPLKSQSLPTQHLDFKFQALYLYSPLQQTALSRKARWGLNDRVILSSDPAYPHLFCLHIFQPWELQLRKSGGEPRWRRR